jgi:hypothetical protein
MPFQLSDIVPWGRSYSEYVAMFALSDDDLKKRVLGCGDGPAGFNAGMTRRGGTVVSVDPLYAFEMDEIEKRIDETFDEVMRETCANRGNFVWEHIHSVEELGRIRMEAMREFLNDYPKGRSEGRYVPGSLPELDFPDNTFDLALCSHFLFLYADRLDVEFHVNAIDEICRVSGEARFFPLLDLDAAPSPHVSPVIEHFNNRGYRVETVRVPYEFQRGGNRMLRVGKSGRLKE